MKTMLILTAMLLAGAQTLWGRIIRPDSVTYQLHDSTMNALDYVLQRSNPPRAFESKKFGDRLFVSAEGGLSYLRLQPDNVIGQPVAGQRAGVTIGDWITPVHGWRLGFSAGRNVGAYRTKTYFGAVSADYLMNLTSLLNGDDPGRTFEIIGTMGAELQMLHRNGHRLWSAGGVTVGLQPRLYLSRSTYLYLEPRLGIYSDGIDDVRSWHRYDWNFQVMLGLGYRLTDIRFRSRNIDNSLWVNEVFRNNLFGGLSLGVNTVGNSITNVRDRIGYTGNVFVGKWFTPVSALRFNLGGGFTRNLNLPKRWIGMLDMDYMFNINSAMNGYDPHRLTECTLLAGVSGAYVSGKGKSFFPGLNAGIQGMLNVSSTVGLFLEPTMRVFGRDFSRRPSSRFTLMPSLSMGIVYRTRPTRESNRHMLEYEDSVYGSARHSFMSLSYGTFQRSRTWVSSKAFSAHFGSWFSPVSAWRAGLELEDYPAKGIREFKALGLSADYMTSISAISAGFDPDRVFDLRAFIGLWGGSAAFSRKYHKPVWGPRVGLQAAFRLSDALDLIIEPQAQIVGAKHYYRRYTPEFRGMIGLSYRLPDRNSFNTSSRLMSENDEAALSRFVSVSAAPGLCTGNLSKLCMTYNVTAGRWFTHVSGLDGYYSFCNASSAGGWFPDFHTIGVDYLLNITSAATGTPSRSFNVVMAAGPGIGWGKKTTLALHGAIQARWNVMKNAELFVAPNAYAWPKRIIGYNRSFIGTVSIEVGASYRF